MKVLVLFAHPNEASYGAALHRLVVDTLRAQGHEVDDCDLYAENFQPVLSRAERLGYHDLAHNREGVADHVDRLLAADALVIVSPIWNFGFPAILKGYFDRVFLPGVSFKIVDGLVVGALSNIRKIVAVTTYGATPLRAFLAGNGPRSFVVRVLRFLAARGATSRYLAHYDMNRSTPATRARFLCKVEAEMRRL